MSKLDNDVNKVLADKKFNELVSDTNFRGFDNWVESMVSLGYKLQQLGHTKDCITKVLNDLFTRYKIEAGGLSKVYWNFMEPSYRYSKNVDIEALQNLVDPKTLTWKDIGRQLTNDEKITYEELNND